MPVRASLLLLAACISWWLAVPVVARASDTAEEASRPGEVTTVTAGFVSPHRRSGHSAALASPLAAAAPSPPFTECPAVGADGSCAILVDVTDSGITILGDPTQGPYDGSDDTLVGVLNQSSKSLGHLSLGSDTYIFGFDGDGLCTYLADPGCPFGPTGYEGPGTSFAQISPDFTSGVVSFSPAIAPGGSAYFSLEEPLTSSAVVSGGPSPIEQGGAPNRSEKHTTCSQGHPVNCATGVFWHEFTDVQVPGRGVPLEFNRTYSSMNAAVDGPLGFGWSDSYGLSLSVDTETGAATVEEEGGSAVTFPSNGEGGFTTPPRVLATLTADEDGTYTFMRFSDHIDYVFSAAGRLLREVDRNGNTTTLSYIGGLLEKVTDPSGRSLTFAYSGSHIHTITDPMGRTTTFSYDGSGNLKEATDPMGRAWSFDYDGSHRLLTMTDPRGGVVSNTYDGSGRVTAQTDPMGRESTWRYEGEAATAEGGATTFTNGRGDVTRYLYRDLELQSVTRGVGTASEATTSYSYDPITLGISAVTDPNGQVTRSHYDAHGDLTETTDPMFRTTFYSYGPEDELQTITDPRGTTTTYRYDPAGNLLEKETPDFQTGETARTNYSYEAAPGELTGVTDPDGHVTTFGYDDAGDRTTVIDAAGNKSTYSYDADGELTSKVSPAGNMLGGDPAAHTTTYAYDADGELTSETDQLGHTRSYGYDGDGNQTTIADANGQTTHQVYDADDELTEVLRPDASVLKTAWDAAGNMTAQTDGAGHATTYAYDALGRVISVTDPDGHTTSYGYDPNGNRTAVVNAEGRLTSYYYDADDEPAAIFYSDGTTPSVSEQYDQDGNRIELTDGTGTSTFSYDSLNRMTKATNGAGATVGYEYDLAGHLTKLIYPNGQSVTRTFDSAGNLTGVTDWLGHTSHFGYDADSNLDEESYGNGVTAQLGYDAADRVASIADSQGSTRLARFTYSRDPLGQVASEASENGEAGTTTYSRNSLDQLTAAGPSAYGYDAADNPTTFGSSAQQFDAANELTSVTGPGMVPEGPSSEPPDSGGPPPPSEPPASGGGGGSGGSPTAGGGTTTSRGAGSPPTTAPPKALRCRKGFRKRVVRGHQRCVKVHKMRRAHHKGHARASALAVASTASNLRGAAAEVPAAQSDRSSSAPGVVAGAGPKPALAAAGEVTRHFDYNARGDRTREEPPGGGSHSLTYDQADRLIAVTGGISYAYDGDGLRTSKTFDGVTTDEVWNQSEEVPELLASGSTSYVYGPNGQPIEQIIAGAATFTQTDQQGSTRLLTDASGAVVGRYDYDAWGNVTTHTGSASSELQFDGQLTDAETGFQYLRARYYDAGTGQFVTPDPLFTISLARHGYGRDDPVDNSDPLGAFSLSNTIGQAWIDVGAYHFFATHNVGGCIAASGGFYGYVSGSVCAGVDGGYDAFSYSGTAGASTGAGASIGISPYVSNNVDTHSGGSLAATQGGGGGAGLAGGLDLSESRDSCGAMRYTIAPFLGIGAGLDVHTGLTYTYTKIIGSFL
ncbi:MAG: DUF6531 domain-containing protein [Solirubrobacterales bacterium]